MKQGGLGFWGTVGATVLGGVATAWLVAASVLAYQHAGGIWHSFGVVAAWAWGIVIYPIPIPTFLILLAAAIAAFSLRHAGKITRIELAGPESSPESHPQLSAVEEDILRALAREDGGWVVMSTLTSTLRAPRLVIAQAIESLENLDLLHNVLGSGGTRYFLTSAGRDYVIEKGYVG